MEEEEQTHTLVFWTKQRSNRKYSMVKRINIDIGEDEEIIESKFYQVYFNKQKYTIGNNYYWHDT